MRGFQLHTPGFAPLALGGISLLVGCAGNPHSAATASPVVPYVEETPSCIPSPLPVVLPPIDEILDSADVIRHIMGSRSNPRPIETVFSLWFGSDGHPRRISAVETNGYEAPGGIMDSVLAQSVHPQSPSAPWTVRVHVLQGEMPSVTLDRSVYCPPKPDALTGPEVGHGVLTLSPQDLQDLQHAGPFRVRVLVNRDGQVIQTDLVRSSGSEIQDRLALDAAGTRHFKPALLDGVPVSGWYEIRSHKQ